MQAYLGIDVGSVSTNLVVITEEKKLIAKLYLRTQGQPLKCVQKGMEKLRKLLPENIEIKGVGTTGSARQLVAVLVGADVVKNEITAHAVAAAAAVPGVQTVLEIGGQDSKIIILRNETVADFAMNTVCAAGTGSFLDQQASRIGIGIEQFGALALQAVHPVRIAGRCTVFAESDMIHKQQMGHQLEDILAGLCQALVRNYLSNVGKGKEILAPIAFQGGVAANIGIRKAFAEELGQKIIIPENFDVMGAIGAAVLAKESGALRAASNFRGFNLSQADFTAGSFECKSCANRCEIIQAKRKSQIVARWGDRCGKWSADLADEASAG